MPMYRKVNKDFFKKWTPAMAYVLGFFAADGYITVNKRGGQFWCLQITDRELLKKIRQAIDSEHKISVKAGKLDIMTLYRLQIGSIEMCNDLRKLGMRERKTKSLTLPNVPKKYFRDFVRGYFDGDGGVWSGHVHKRRQSWLLTVRIVFTSCSHDFIDLLHKRLSKIIGSGGSIIRHSTFCRLQYSTGNALKLYGFMYNHKGSSSLFLERKKKVFDGYLSRVKKMRL